MVLLEDLQVGDKVKILGFNSDIDLSNIAHDAVYQQRLLAMGFVPEAEFSVIRIAPLGDPIEIRLNHLSLCIRKEEGAILQLERIGRS